MDGVIALICLIWGIVCGLTAVLAAEKKDMVSAVCFAILSTGLITAYAMIVV